MIGNSIGSFVIMLGTCLRLILLVIVCVFGGFVAGIAWGTVSRLFSAVFTGIRGLMMGGGDGWGTSRESVFSISSRMHLSFVTDDCLQIAIFIIIVIVMAIAIAHETTILSN